MNFISPTRPPSHVPPPNDSIPLVTQTERHGIGAQGPLPREINKYARNLIHQWTGDRPPIDPPWSLDSVVQLSVPCGWPVSTHGGRAQEEDKWWSVGGDLRDAERIST